VALKRNHIFYCGKKSMIKIVLISFLAGLVSALSSDLVPVIKRQDGSEKVQCTVAKPQDFSLYNCILSNPSSSSVKVYFTTSKSNENVDNTGITLNKCSLQFEAGSVGPLELRLNIPGTISSKRFKIEYVIDAPHEAYHLCSGSFGGKRKSPPPPVEHIKRGYCGISGDPHVFMFSNYGEFGTGFTSTTTGHVSTNDFLKKTNAYNIPAFSSGTFWILKSTMGLSIQGVYSGECINKADTTSEKIIESCVDSVYIQYFSEGFYVNLEKKGQSAKGDLVKLTSAGKGDYMTIMKSGPVLIFNNFSITFL